MGSRVSGHAHRHQRVSENQLIGTGGAIEGGDWTRNDTERHELDKTIGTSGQSDAYTDALASIEAEPGLFVDAAYVGALSARVHGQTIHVFTNNRTVLATLRTPARRSRQWIISGILTHARYLKGFAIRIVFAWAPVSLIFELEQKAKQLAQRSTEEGRVARDRPRLTKSMVRNAQQRLSLATSRTPTTFGESVRRIDAAWPGSHTRRIYDGLSKRQASVLAQLRTGMTPLNGYLQRITAVESDLCECGEAIESREHFVFRCTRWSEQRKMLGVWTAEDKLSRLLGGKTSTDTEDWTPDKDAVRAVIHFTLATIRFERDTSTRRRTRGR